MAAVALAPLEAGTFPDARSPGVESSAGYLARPGAGAPVG